MNHKTILRTIETLAALFPYAFVANPREPHRPLRIGIRDELIASGIMSWAETRRALFYYVNRVMYLRAFVPGAVRVGLDGPPAGTVTEAEIAHAQEKLTIILQAREAVAGLAQQSLRQAREAKAQAGAASGLLSNAGGLKAGPLRGKLSLSAMLPRDSANSQIQIKS
jgi:ProP effector